MFSIRGIISSCGSGCQNLWSDPNKLAGTYGVVNKEEAETGDHEFEEEPLSPDDIVTSQPIWTESPIVKNALPQFSRKSVPIVKIPSQSDVTKNKASSSVSRDMDLRRGSLGSNQRPNIFTSPIVKSSSSQVLSAKRSNNTYQSSRKQKSEEVKLQIVSVV